MHELTIHILPVDEGYQYDIYKGSPTDADEAESVDGGLCTTTLANALDMATAQAKMLAYCDECMSTPCTQI